MLRTLHQANISLVISVPPDESRFRFYDLSNTVNMARFVIVKTHTLVMPGIVACNGDRVSATRLFNKIIEPINVGPDTFTTTSAQLWVRSSGPSSWDNYTLQPGKAHLASVCKQSPRFYPFYPECFFSSQIVTNDEFLIATLLTRYAVRIRIKKSYDDGAAIAPVMVYDIDLDDFNGNCSDGLHLFSHHITTGHVFLLTSSSVTFTFN
ncbi:hypothetical protein MRX96_017854 [Rhipicephalus microplus]